MAWSNNNRIIFLMNRDYWRFWLPDRVLLQQYQSQSPKSLSGLSFFFHLSVSTFFFCFNAEEEICTGEFSHNRVYFGTEQGLRDRVCHVGLSGLDGWPLTSFLSSFRLSLNLTRPTTAANVSMLDGLSIRKKWKWKSATINICKSWDCQVFIIVFNFSSLSYCWKIN